MSAESMPTVPLSGAVGVQRASRSFHLNLPILIGAFAAAGALGQLNAASLSPVKMPAASSHEAATFEQLSALRLVEDARWLVPAGLVEAEGLAMSSPSPRNPDVPPATPADALLLPGLPADPAAHASQDSSAALNQASFADRLRDDPVQSAPVPETPAVKPSPPVKLTRDQRAIARHITRSYRLALAPVEQFVHHAFKAAREYRLDPHLVLAVMAVESGFDPEAESGAGAQGLMQVHTKVHTSKFEPFGGIEAAYDPAANIKVGTRILSEYVNRYGDVAAGLKAYVGAALLPSDGGYGHKVLSRRNEFEAVIRPVEPPPVAVAGDSESAPPAAVEVLGSSASPRDASPGL